MLKYFRVNNFKSLINLEFFPVGLNLLVGPNNSGKTNLSQALRFLSLTARFPVGSAATDSAIEPWNLLNVNFESDALELELKSELLINGAMTVFNYKLKIRGYRSVSLSSGFAVLEESLVSYDDKHKKESLLLENREGNARYLDESQPTVEPLYVKTTVPQESTMLHVLYDFEKCKTAFEFKKYLVAFCYYNFDPYHMRSVSKLTERILNIDGSNLGSCLYALHNERPSFEKILLEKIRRLEPSLEYLSFYIPDPDRVFMYFEDQRQNRFGVWTQSDGTLRYLGMMYAVLSAHWTSTVGSTPQVIIIEEPENGLYVGHLKSLIEAIDPTGKGGQFIFTSHNPYLIDLFDGALDGINVLKMENRITTITKPDQARLKKKLEDFSLGELHYRNLLA